MSVVHASAPNPFPNSSGSSWRSRFWSGSRSGRQVPLSTLFVRGRPFVYNAEAALRSGGLLVTGGSGVATSARRNIIVRRYRILGVTFGLFLALSMWTTLAASQWSHIPSTYFPDKFNRTPTQPGHWDPS